MFRERCPFNQYVLSKPAKYGIKIGAVRDIQSNFARTMQMYAGKSPGEALGEELQKSKVIMLATMGKTKTSWSNIISLCLH